jgi:hypothetical protein
MATRDQVKNSLDVQITNDAKARRKQAGNAWTTLQMDFYYGVGNEVSVDIAVKGTMLRLLAAEHKLLPDQEWAGLRHDVNSTTIVEGAIDRMHSASLRAKDEL